jgi:large subunit ribosomal protein L35
MPTKIVLLPYSYRISQSSPSRGTCSESRSSSFDLQPAMLRLRASTRPVCRGLVRLSSTTAAPAADAVPAAASGDSATPADAAATDAATHGRRKPVRRSLGARGETREWNRPLATGVLPAYDEALALLRADARTLKAELADVQARLKGASGEEADALRKKVEILEIQSEINLPDVRWKSRNGLGEWDHALAKDVCVYSYLRWQVICPSLCTDVSPSSAGVTRVRSTCSFVSVLSSRVMTLTGTTQMERIHQMNVVPDVIPDLHPSFDLRVAFSQFSSALGHPVHMAVEPGVHVAPKDVSHVPYFHYNDLANGDWMIDTAEAAAVRHGLPPRASDVHSAHGRPGRARP